MSSRGLESIDSNPECEVTRQLIQSAIRHIATVSYFMKEFEVGYSDHEESLSGDLNDAQDAFDKRPIGCKMTRSDRDWYSCSTCIFSASI